MRLAGAPPPSQWETFPRTLLLTLAVCLAALVALYWIGMSFLVGFVARQVPQSVLEAIGRETLASLDRSTFEPSALPEWRQQSIAGAFGRLPLPQDVRHVARLEFRASPALGANALALPSGTIVVTDDLVALARDDEDVVAVLAHEAGHLDGRHGMRAVVQSALLSTLITLVAGDASALAAAAPAALLDARYSRSLEREADAYAVASLRAGGIRPTRLADMLERMEKAQAQAGREGPTGAVAYLSTHPTTAERLETLRGER